MILDIKVKLAFIKISEFQKYQILKLQILKYIKLQILIEIIQFAKNEAKSIKMTNSLVYVIPIKDGFISSKNR